MFSGLFSQRPSNQPKVQRPGKVQSQQGTSGASGKGNNKEKADKGSKKEGLRRKGSQDQNISGSKSKRKHTGGSKSNAPAGGIPMSDEEITRFEEWLADNKIGPAMVGKRKRQDPIEPKSRRSDSTNSLTACGSQTLSEPTTPLSRKARKRQRQLQRQEHESNRHDSDNQHAAKIDALSAAAADLPRVKGLGSVGKAAARLQGSRFRWLNDTLYSITGREAKELYDNDPSLAAAYHEGFREQVRKWPRNPLDDVIRWLRQEVSSDKVVGDFGCGEARLALELSDRTVHSFDLLKINERVTACNLASVPLAAQSIDVAVFCLALMGTDWPSFLKEAHRCLRPDGILQIMEVESRMSNVEAMTTQVEGIGFRKVFVKPGNFFIEMRFTKSNKSSGKQKPKFKKGGNAVLAGCTYRKR